MDILTQGATRPPHIDTLTHSGRWSGYVVRNPIKILTLGGGKAERTRRDADADLDRLYAWSGR